MSTMGSRSLNNSVSSLIDESLFGEEEEDAILSRLSPYATLRASDLSTLARQSQEFLHRKGLVAAFAKRFSPEATTFCDQKRKSSLCHVSEEHDVVLRAQDIGDLPIEYTIRKIRPHEMPVIGVYVDTRIVPGFRYRVRHLGSERYVFGGRALTLLSIGLGYGKRLTFQGDSHNFNNNYFWSDSDPNGFGFSLEAVRPGDKFSVFCTNGTGIVGEVKVETVSGVQEEISSEVVKGDIIKQVHVTFECSVTYHQRHHGKVSYKLLDLEKLSGVAYVIKKKGSRVAELDCIYNVTLSRIPDVCTLQFEP